MARFTIRVDTNPNYPFQPAHLGRLETYYACEIEGDPDSMMDKNKPRSITITSNWHTPEEVIRQIELSGYTATLIEPD